MEEVLHSSQCVLTKLKHKLTYKVQQYKQIKPQKKGRKKDLHGQPF